jgi:M6 family metalloprotease-like protein
MLISFLLVSFKGVCLAVPPCPLVYNIGMKDNAPSGLLPPPAYIRDLISKPPSAPVTGTRRVVVILVEFPDTRASAKHPPSYYQRLIFDRSYQGSLARYYEEVSYGLMRIEGVVAGNKWYKAKYPMFYYGRDGISGTDSAYGPVYRLALEAIALADEDVDFSDFDMDGDRVVDHIMIIHAGEGQERSGRADDIWSHRWEVDSNPALPGNQGLSVDGVYALGYTMQSEDSPVGVFAHEFAHDLGIPDLYVEGAPSPVGRWSLMGHGAWLGNPPGSLPAHLDPWSKALLGWINPITLTGNASQVQVKRIETYREGSLYKIPYPGIASEYLLIENRQRIGFDSGLPGDGILVWHIDDSVGSLEKGDVNRDPKHPRVALVPADGSLLGGGDATDPFYLGNKTEITPISTPNIVSYTGNVYPPPIMRISHSGEIMTMDVGDFLPPILTVTVTRDPATAGPIGIRVSSNEPLSLPPKVVVTQDGLKPKEINVVKVDDRTYLGSYEVIRGYDGPATVDVEGTDLFGNVGHASIQFEVDTVIPKVERIEIITPPGQEGVKPGDEISILVVVDDNGQTSVSLDCSELGGPSKLFPEKNGSSSKEFITSLVVGDVEDGTARIYVTAVRVRNGEIATYSSNPIIVDSSKPLISLLKAEIEGGKRMAKKGDLVKITAFVGPNPPDRYSVVVNAAELGVPLSIPAAIYGNAFVASFNVGDNIGGELPIKVTAINRVNGLRSTSQVSIAVDNTPPHAFISRPSNGEKILGGVQGSVYLVLMGTRDNDVSRISVQIRGEGGQWADLGSIAGDNPTFPMNTSSLTPGMRYYLRAVAEDMAGNIDPEPDTVYFTVEEGLIKPFSTSEGIHVDYKLKPFSFTIDIPPSPYLSEELEIAITRTSTPMAIPGQGKLLQGSGLRIDLSHVLNPAVPVSLDAILTVEIPLEIREGCLIALYGRNIGSETWSRITAPESKGLLSAKISLPMEICLVSYPSDSRVIGMERISIYPNPFSRARRGYVVISAPAGMRIKGIYSGTGAVVLRVDKPLDILKWDGRDMFGKDVPPGVYLVDIEGEGRRVIGKAVIK